VELFLCSPHTCGKTQLYFAFLLLYFGNILVLYYTNLAIFRTKLVDGRTNVKLRTGGSTNAFIITIIIIIIIKIKLQKTAILGTTENSHIGHCTHTPEVTNVKIQ
jgi:uncharacterized membrane protein